MEGRLRPPFAYTGKTMDFNSRRISSCSSGSTSSSSYASSDDNMFLQRSLENCHAARHLDQQYHCLSHDNEGYHHEEGLHRDSLSSGERARPLDNCKGNRQRTISPSSIYPFNVNSHINQPAKQTVTTEQSLFLNRGNCRSPCHRLQNEQMMGRPLPLTPPTDGYCIDSRPHTPLRYQNDSPFVTTSRAGTGSTNHTKRSFTKSPSSQLETQSADDKQRNAEELLKQVPWFQPKLNREEVLQKLSKEDLGSFIIRESSTHTSCFALSVKVPKFNNPSGIAHYIIHRTPSQGFKIKGLEKEWNNLSSLVIHHTIMPELLPCTLKVPPPPSLRRPSTTSRGSNSSRGSSSPSPSLISKPTTPNQPDRIIHSLDKKFTVHEAV